MTTVEEKKEREAAAVMAVLERLDVEPSDLVRRESPDFEARFADGRRVGIEVVELTDGAIAASHTKRTEPRARRHLSGRRVVVFIQGRIDAKNEKLPMYLDNLPGHEMWLVLVVGLDGPPGVRSDVIEDHEFVSSFDRTFCVDAKGPIELRTREPR